MPQWIADWIPSWAAKAALGTAILLGVAGLYSSAMIYVATKRHLWRFTRTMNRFFGSAFVLGTAFAAAGLHFGQAPSWITALVVASAIVFAGAKLWWEWQIHLSPARPDEDTYDVRSKALVARDLQTLSQRRLGFSFAALSVFAVMSLAALAMPAISGAVVLCLFGGLLLGGEYLERLLYFSSVVYDRMPGTIR